MNHDDNPVVWTLHRETKGGDVVIDTFPTFEDARLQAMAWTKDPACRLATVSYGENWRQVTLFLYKASEVRNDQPIQESRNPGRRTPKP